MIKMFFEKAHSWDAYLQILVDAFTKYFTLPFSIPNVIKQRLHVWIVLSVDKGLSVQRVATLPLLTAVNTPAVSLHSAAGEMWRCDGPADQHHHTEFCEEISLVTII